MKILVRRKVKGFRATLGLLYVKSTHECYTLEDVVRKEKIKGQTAIPAGEYQVLLRDEDTPMNKKYHKLYPGLHEGMLWLQDVPNFTYIYIHRGNDEDDTEGCILVGTAWDPRKELIYNSAVAYEKLYRKLVAAAKAGDLWITVEDDYA